MMMNAFMEPAAPTHAHHLAPYGLKMSPPLQSSAQENGNGMLGAMNSSAAAAAAAEHNAVGIANNAAYQSSGYGPSAAATAPYTSYGRDYLFKREQDYLGMPASAANPAAATEPMLFPGIHHTHAMHDNQFAYHQHQMRMGITSGSAAASVPQAAGELDLTKKKKCMTNRDFYCARNLLELEFAKLLANTKEIETFAING